MSATIHGSCVLLDDGGLLICGPSGSGKSFLAQALVARWRGRGRFAALVGDDRVIVEPRGGRLLARPQPVIAGRVEVRGVGLVKMSHEPCCVLRAGIELDAEAGERLPDSESLFRAIAGVKLPLARMFIDRWLVDRVETFWFQTYL